MTTESAESSWVGAACVLTDDEIVALMVDVDGAWPLPLPTVATWDSDELSRSAMRGWRSLALRGGLGEDGSALDVFNPITSAALVSSTLVLFIGDDDAQPITWDFSYGAVRTADGWLLDEMTAGGIHRLWRVESTDAIARFMTNLLQQVNVDGVSSRPEANDLWAYLAATETSGSRMLGVAREAIMELHTDAEGLITLRESTEVSLQELVLNIVVAGYVRNKSATP